MNGAHVSRIYDSPATLEPLIPPDPKPGAQQGGGYILAALRSGQFDLPDVDRVGWEREMAALVPAVDLGREPGVAHRLPPLPRDQTGPIRSVCDGRIARQRFSYHVAQQRPVRAAEGTDIHVGRRGQLRQPGEIGLDQESPPITGDTIKMPTHVGQVTAQAIEDHIIPARSLTGSSGRAATLSLNSASAKSSAASWRLGANAMRLQVP